MGLFSKKKKQPTGDKACQQGYVSFTPEDIKAKEETSKDNSESYDLLWQAVTTSSHISKKDKKGKVVDVDDVYPISLEETLEMENLLNQAEAKIQDHNDTELKDQIDEVRYIVNWSKKRHFNFSWLVILGVILGLFVLKYFRSEPREKANEWAKVCKHVDKEWTEQDTILVWDSVVPDHLFDYSHKERFENAKDFKAITSSMYKSRYEYYVGEMATNQAKIDTASSRKVKNYYKDELKHAKKRAEENLELGQEICSADYNEIHKIAQKQVNGIRKVHSKEARKYTIWIWIFIIMIPLYIFADRPYGWMESRHRVEAQLLGGIKKLGYSIAAFMATMGVGMQFLPDEKTTMFNYNTGRNESTTTFNTGNIYIMIMKVGLVIGAILVAAFTSMFIMAYSTVVGLIRNYDWKSIKADAKEKLGKN